MPGSEQCPWEEFLVLCDFSLGTNTHEVVAVLSWRIANFMVNSG